MIHPCSLPWDPVYLIESLSDSTIYMAYYAVAHVLQGGDMYCDDANHGPTGINPEDLTKDVWDYIFMTGDYEEDQGRDPPSVPSISHELLKKMRREFAYWYPFDLRVSGKDLIQNHLTFCLYNHTAIWSHNPSMWPLSIRCNGHLLLNAEKMSKSTGNFMTLHQAVMEYSADAMRVALADAGDALDDANYEHPTANGAILRLTKELTWIQEVLDAADSMRDEPPTGFLDRAFENEINTAIIQTKANYDKMLFREALKSGWYDLTSARDIYRFGCGPEGMNKSLIMRYIDVSTRVLTPICPHTCEHVWSDLLKRDGCVVNAGWPAASQPDHVLQQAASYLEASIHNLRKIIIKVENPPKPKKAGMAAPVAQRVVGMQLVVPQRYGGWQAKILNVVSSIYENNNGTFPDNTIGMILATLKADENIKALGSKMFNTVIMPFVRGTIESAKLDGSSSLSLSLPFDEAAILQENAGYLQRALNLKDPVVVKSISYDEQEASEDEKIRESFPGSPGVFFTTVAKESMNGTGEGH